MTFYNQEEFKTKLKIDNLKEDQKQLLGVDSFYIVPYQKNYNRIRPSGNDKWDKKEPFLLLELDDPFYNSLLHIYEDGTFSQFRDGCFYPYVGKIAI